MPEEFAVYCPTAMRSPFSASALAILGAVVSVVGCGGTSGLPSADQAAKARATVRRIPAIGSILGSPSAPYKLVVFARLDDLRAAAFVNETLPELVASSVRPGRLKIQLRTLSPATAETGADAEALARLVQGAGLTGRFWDVLGTIAASYVGVVDDSLQMRIARDTGLDVPKLRALGDSPRATRALMVANEMGDQLAARRFALVLQDSFGRQTRMPTERRELVVALAKIIDKRPSR